MRITNKESEILIRLAVKHFGKEIQVRLFGSRVNEKKKGGDIDIHVSGTNASLMDEINFLSDAQGLLDEKIDLRVQKDELLIDRIAKKEGIILYGE